MWQVESQREYERRLNRVVNHIVAHLGEPLSLEVLAHIACFSPYHFHRIFRGMTGETITDFIWRLRLERAANQLLQRPGRPITTIALECGFATPSSFSRAFRARFGMSPTSFRLKVPGHGKQWKAVPAPDRHDGLTRPARANVEGATAMDVEIRTLPPYRVVYVRRLGYEKGVFQEHLGEAFKQVCGWVAGHGVFGPDTLVIGVPHDNPEITPTERCRYDACVTIPEGMAEANGDIDYQYLQGGRYAVARLDVTGPAAIGEAVDALYGTWLPASGYQTDDRPCLEIYHDGSPGHIVLDYCVPVVPLEI